MADSRVRPRMGRVLALSVAAVLSGCAGENLFSLAAGVGAGGPTVEITAPAADLTVAVGTPLQIRATVNAPSGLQSAQYSAVYTGDGTAAYTSETESFSNPPFADLDNTLNAVAGQGEGDVWAIVRVVDGTGEAKADTVKITLIN